MGIELQSPALSGWDAGAWRCSGLGAGRAAWPDLGLFPQISLLMGTAGRKEEWDHPGGESQVWYCVPGLAFLPSPRTRPGAAALTLLLPTISAPPVCAFQTAPDYAK